MRQPKSGLNDRPLIQMSTPKRVCPNIATATPSARRGAQTSQKQHAGLPELDAQPSGASVRLP